MEEPKGGLLAECREWWRLASVKLAAFVGLISSIVSANPDFLLTLAAIIPAATGPRLFFALGVGALVFAVPTITRIWPQSEKVE